MSASLLRRSIRLPLCSTCHRTLATTATTTATPTHPSPPQKQTSTLEPLPTSIPPYPYGPAQWYKQSDRGLYGGQRIQFGNNVGPRSGVRTRRSWAVNVFNKRLWSRALNEFIKLRVSKKVLRTIDKVGGLDEYLLGEKEGRIRGLGVRGWELRWAVLQTPGVRRRFERERAALGVGGLEEEVNQLEGEAAVEEDVDEVAEALEDSQSQDVTAATTPPAEKRPPSIYIGQNRRLTLTHQGFRRRVPVPKADAETRIRTQILRDQVRSRLKDIREHIAQQSETLLEGRPLKPKERRAVVDQAKRALKKELAESEEVQEQLQERLAFREKQISRNERLKEGKRKRRRAAWREIVKGRREAAKVDN